MYRLCHDQGLWHSFHWYIFEISCILYIFVSSIQCQSLLQRNCNGWMNDSFWKCEELLFVIRECVHIADFFFLSWCAILPSKSSSGGVPVKKKSLTFGLCNDKLILIGNLPDSSVPSVIYAQLILFGNRNKWKQNSHRFGDKQEKKPSESSPQKTKLEIDPTF